VSDPDRLEPVSATSGPFRPNDGFAIKRMPRINRPNPEVNGPIFDHRIRVAQSETLREAEQVGIYAAEEIGLDGAVFSASRRALDYLKVSQENAIARTSTLTPDVRRKTEAAYHSIDTPGRAVCANSLGPRRLDNMTRWWRQWWKPSRCSRRERVRTLFANSQRRSVSPACGPSCLPETWKN